MVLEVSRGCLEVLKGHSHAVSPHMLSTDALARVLRLVTAGEGKIAAIYSWSRPTDERVQEALRGAHTHGSRKTHTEAGGGPGVPKGAQGSPGVTPTHTQLALGQPVQAYSMQLVFDVGTFPAIGPLPIYVSEVSRKASAVSAAELHPSARRPAVAGTRHHRVGPGRLRTTAPAPQPSWEHRCLIL